MIRVSWGAGMVTQAANPRIAGTSGIAKENRGTLDLLSKISGARPAAPEVWAAQPCQRPSTQM
jgi:hypothetical protein